MEAKVILSTIAVVLLVAAGVSRVSNQGSAGARRTWLLIAAIFLGVSAYLHFIGIEFGRNAKATNIVTSASKKMLRSYDGKTDQVGSCDGAAPLR